MNDITSASSDGKLTRSKLHAVLAALCELAGLDGRDADLIKFTNNAVFRLGREQVVVRIAGSSATRRRIEKVVQVARWLAEHRIRAVRLVPDIPQPVTVAGHSATLWQLIPAVGAVPTGTDLARLLHDFHNLPTPVEPLPPWRPFDEIRERLAEPEGLAAADHAYLVDRCDQLEAELASVQYVLPSGPIHGDAFLGNIIPGPEGSVFCDFDSTCIGPREWDLTPVAVGRLRLNYTTDDHTPLARSYGFDVTAWEGFPVLRRVRELKLVTSVVPILASNPSVRDQWQHRFQTFRNNDMLTKWTPY